MAQITGTKGKDVVTVGGGDWYDALEGDDDITLPQIQGPSATIQAGAGNDRIVGLGSAQGQGPWELGVVWYWSSPGPIYVDLKEGYALDGFGTRDTLVNIRRVHGFQKDGDKGYGTDEGDEFYLGSPYGNRTGNIYVDGRGGDDQVGINLGGASAGFGALQVKVNADGRSGQIWFANHPSYLVTIKNIEQIGVYDPDANRGYSIRIFDQISLDTAGQDILLRGDRGLQTGNIGNAVTISYGFLSAAPASGGEGGTGFVPYSEAQKTVIRQVFAQLQAQTQITFQEVAGDAATIRLGINQQANTRGYSFIPDEYKSDPRAGDIWLDVETVALLNPGQEGYYTLLHELGHALGLQHPLPESDTSGPTVLLERFAKLSNTVMLDRSTPDVTGLWPSWFGAFDLQAIRALYGAKSYNAGDNRYVYADLTRFGSATIVDDGGAADVIDASGSPLSAVLDLRPGFASSMGASSDGRALFNNVNIAAGSWIEQAVGTAGDDLITGNRLGNTIWGKGGNDIIDGQEGVDWTVFDGRRADYSAGPSGYGSAWTVAARDGLGGLLELNNIERVRYSDVDVAIDLGVNQSAGQAILLVGAIFGRAVALNAKPVLGVAMDIFDQGFSLQTLAGGVLGLPIWAGALTPTDSSADKARYLLTVVHGRAPTNEEVAAAAQAIDGDKAVGRAGQWLADLATSPANQTQVDLVGLQQSGGLVFIPPGG